MAALMDVGVVGAGQMGAGIAQIAALAGHRVRLLDSREGAAGAAVRQLDATLAKLVDKGKLDAAAHAAAMARLQAVASVEQLAGCGLVIEAIVEQAEPKRALFRQLEAVVEADAVIASNTSSISITLLANGLARPQQLVGMHFFNPVPLMRLVEVVSGAETAPAVAARIEQLALAWGKTPVHAASTPGFIVNRIARPYYAEALALLHEQALAPVALDQALRAAGFRMGPCELMDLIGHDTNLLVTRSVWEANFGDRRYQPSGVQQALVDGGRLGRKSGRGFHAGEAARLGPVKPPASAPALRIGGTHAGSRWLAARRPDLPHDPAAPAGLQADGEWLLFTDGRCAYERGASLLDWPLHPQADALAVALYEGAELATDLATVQAALAAFGLHALPQRDTPGLVVARTLAMLVNEASDAVWQGVCTEAAADTAMRLGVNYPAGPFDWLRQLGAPACVGLLDQLWAHTRSERYRVSPPLRRAAAGARGGAATPAGEIVPLQSMPAPRP